jgi:quercetin dioxygenase-like cupin family protein
MDGKGVAMKSCVKVAMIVLSLVVAAPTQTSSQDAFKVNELLQKDISKYANSDLRISVAEITLAPGANGTKHRHPGPTFVYVLAGDVEAEFEGVPARTYHTGETMYEDPRQLHISTKNPSKTEPARILVVHLSHNGEALTELEK